MKYTPCQCCCTADLDVYHSIHEYILLICVCWRVLLLLFLLPSDNVQHDLQHGSLITFPKEENLGNKRKPMHRESTSLPCQLSACLLVHVYIYIIMFLDYIMFLMYETHSICTHFLCQINTPLCIQRVQRGCDPIALCR